MPKREDFITTRIAKSNGGDDFNKGCVSYIEQQLDTWQIARQEREDIWLECWAMYFANPAANHELRKRIYHTVGDVKNDWRHRLSTGKAFEQVETVLAHMMAAFFPNRDWFEAVPVNSGYQELADLIRKYTQKKLGESHFISHWQTFLRQLLITGSSVMALPWRKETTKWRKKVKVEQPERGPYSSLEYGEKAKWKTIEQEKIIQNRPDFETLDMFDCWFDPKAIAVDESDFIRRIVKSKSEMAELITAGYYKNISVYDIVSMSPYWGSDISASNRVVLKDFEGVEVENGYCWSDHVELFEYWGDVTVDGVVYKDITATICNGELLRFENNPYWCGKPFVFGTYIPINRSTSAMGVIEPSLGLLHEMNILTNQRLDNLELSVNSMWEHIDDGTLAPEDIYSEPGRVFSVSQQGTLNPIAMPNQYMITYDEQSVLEQRIDKNAGTGMAISANASRDAERVTATEIRAVREAGGSRLSSLHKHVEETALMGALNKVFRLFQQFVNEDEIIRVSGANPGDYDFYAVGIEELQNDFILTPVGANHVADKEFEIGQRLQFLTIVSQNPQMSQHINYYNFMLDLARRMGIDDIDQFIVEQSPEMPMMEGQMPGGQQIQQGINDEVGKPMTDALRNNINADGGQQMMQQMFDVDSANLPPDIAQLAGI